MRWPRRWPFHDDGAAKGATVARDTPARDSRTPDAGTAALPAGGGPVAQPHSARRDWASLPPLQRSFEAPPLTAESGAFARAVAADAALPLALAPLGHAREADAPGGMVRGLATTITDRTTVGVGDAVGGTSPDISQPFATTGGMPSGQHGQHAAGVPGRHVQRVMTAPRGGRRGELTEPDNGSDSVGIGGSSSVGTPPDPLSHVQRDVPPMTARTPDASGVARTAGMDASPGDRASSLAPGVGLPPVQRLHDLPVRISGSATSEAERHPSLVSAEMTLPASPAGLVRRSTAASTGPVGLPARGDHDEPGRGSVDVQRSAGPASGSTPAPERPVRLSVGQVRRLGLGTPFTQSRPSPSSGMAGVAGTATGDSAIAGAPSNEAGIAPGPARPAGSAPTDAVGPTIAREAASSTLDSKAIGMAHDSRRTTVGTGGLPLAEVRGHGRSDKGNAEASGAPHDSTGRDGDDDHAEGGGAGDLATISRGAPGDQPSAAATGTPEEAARATGGLGAARAVPPTAGLESLASAPSHPRPGLGAPSPTAAGRWARGREPRSGERGDASAGSETPVAQRATINPVIQAVPLPGRVRLPGTARNDALQRTPDADVAFPTDTLGGEGVAQTGQLLSAPARHAVVSRLAHDAPGSLVAATPDRPRGPLVTQHAQTPSAPPRAGTTRDEPMTLVRAFHAFPGGGSETDDSIRTSQPTVARSIAGQTSAADFAGAESTQIAATGAFPAHESGGLPSVQREDGTDAAVAAAASSATAGGGSPAGGSERELDELARRLYDRIRSRLRTELLVDRERAGALSDLV